MTRLRALAALLVLAVAACGSEPASNAQVLRYGYAPGDTVVYDMAASVTGSFSIDGDLGEDLPAEFSDGMAEVDVEVETRLTYSIEAGDDPTTSVITITQQITALSGTFDGMSEAMTLDDLGELPPTTIEATIDAQGAVISASVDGQEIPLGLLDLGGLSDGGAGDLGSQFLNPQHLGPQFPDDAVGVGDDWEVDADATALGLTVSKTAEYEITAEETVAGRSTLRIEGTATTDAIELGLADLAGALLGGLDGEASEDLGIDLDPETMAGFLEALGIEMSLEIAESRSTSTTWFDPVGGIVVRYEDSSPVELAISIGGVPDLPGDVTVDLDFTIDQSLTLVEP